MRQTLLRTTAALALILPALVTNAMAQQKRAGRTGSGGARGARPHRAWPPRPPAPRMAAPQPHFAAPVQHFAAPARVAAPTRMAAPAHIATPHVATQQISRPSTSNCSYKRDAWQCGQFGRKAATNSVARQQRRGAQFCAPRWSDHSERQQRRPDRHRATRRSPRAPRRRRRAHRRAGLARLPPRDAALEMRGLDGEQLGHRGRSSPRRCRCSASSGTWPRSGARAWFRPPVRAARRRVTGYLLQRGVPGRGLRPHRRRQAEADDFATFAGRVRGGRCGSTRAGRWTRHSVADGARWTCAGSTCT